MAPEIVWNPKRKSLVLAGLFDVPAPFSVRVIYRDASGRLLTLVPGERAAPKLLGNGHWVFSEDDMIVTLMPRPGEGRGIAWSILIEPTKTPIELEAIAPFTGNPERWLMATLEDCRFFYNGYHSWTPSGLRPATDAPAFPLSHSFALMNHYVDSPFWGRRDGLLSSHLAMLLPGKERAADGFLCGFLEQKTGLGEIFLKNARGRELIAQLDFGGRRVSRGERLISDVFWAARGHGEALLAAFASKCAEAMGAPRIRPEASPSGYCSWYELYTRVREADMLANLQVVHDHPELGLSVIQLDDGYQRAVGDWLSRNRKFPRELSALSHSIHRAGLKAGIWTAPFLAAPRSKLAAERREWLLRDPEGHFLDCGFNPMWKTRVLALDPAHPGVQEWLLEVFETLCNWGFDYFKVDFLFAGLRRGRHFEPGASPVEAYRRGVQAIRKAIGPNRFLLGCGAPIGPSIGLFDGMRISEDVKEVWEANWFWRRLGRGCGVPSASGALKNTLERAYMHRRYWLNDPDCLLVRGKNSALTENEVKSLSTVLGMSGGMMFMSDALDRLEPERLEIAKAVLPPSPVGCEPKDRFSAGEGGPPRLFEVKGKGRRALGILNWDPFERNENISLGIETGAWLYEFWRDQPVLEGKTSLPIPAHGCAVCIETPASPLPTLIGSSIHLMALLDGRIDGQFDEKSGELLIEGRGVSRRRGSLWIAVPPEFIFEGRELPGGVVDARLWEAGLRLWVEGESPWTIRMKFNRINKKF